LMAYITPEPPVIATTKRINSIAISSASYLICRYH
jgi:hypothetical protein